MGFVAEDGTGKSDANSLTTVEFADAYFQDRGITSWAGTQNDKRAWLIRATDYIEKRFGDKFKGSPSFDGVQALSFPRDAFSGMPQALQKACAEYALRARSAPLAPDPSWDTNGLTVKRIREKVGPVDTETEYMDGNKVPLRAYPEADALLRPLLRSVKSVYR